MAIIIIVIILITIIIAIIITIIIMVLFNQVWLASVLVTRLDLGQMDFPMNAALATPTTASRETLRACPHQSPPSLSNRSEMNCWVDQS